MKLSEQLCDVLNRPSRAGRKLVAAASSSAAARFTLEPASFYAQSFQNDAQHVSFFINYSKTLLYISIILSSV